MLISLYLAALLVRGSGSLRMRDIGGVEHSVLGPRGSAIFFIASECPISNGYAPVIENIIGRFKSQGFRFFIVYEDPGLTVRDIRDHAKSYAHVQCPIVFDPAAKWALKFGAKITPEVVVLDSKGIKAYDGRIDDRYPSLGVLRDKPQHTDLIDALSALDRGSRPAEASTAAVGCYIVGVPHA